MVIYLLGMLTCGLSFGVYLFGFAAAENRRDAPRGPVDLLDVSETWALATIAWPATLATVLAGLGFWLAMSLGHLQRFVPKNTYWRRGE